MAGLDPAIHVLPPSPPMKGGYGYRNASSSRKPLLLQLPTHQIEACMLTGELRSKIDNVWNAFWAGGIANPLEVIEQITYLLFMRGLDDLHTLEENKANRLKKPI
jgi:HsdM N-terminal domain